MSSRLCLSPVNDAANAEYDYFMKNMKDPSVREKFYNKQLNLDSSSSDEESGAAATEPSSKQHTLASKIISTPSSSKGKTGTLNQR